MRSNPIQKNRAFGFCLVASLLFLISTIPEIKITADEKKLSVVLPNKFENREYNFGGRRIGNPANAAANLSEIYKHSLSYKRSNGGSYPKNISKLTNFIALSGNFKNIAEYKSIIGKLMNPDSQFSDSEYLRNHAKSFIPYFMLNRRPNGESYDQPKRRGEKDVISYTDLYVHSYEHKTSGFRQTGFYGFYVLLWDDGQVEQIPFDRTVTVRDVDGDHTGFLGQAGIPFDSLSFEESDLYSTYAPTRKPLTGDRVIQDNGGPESLVNLSRSSFLLGMQGLDRGDLWTNFAPSQSEFTLSNIQLGATKLGLDTSVQKLSLSQLQRNGSSSLLFLKDDGRIVTLTALDDDRAVVIDRGLTRNVERSVLEKRYSGEALIPTKALTQNVGIVADDAVREVKLPSLEAEVPQSVTLRNTGKTPVTLQLEYPLLGVTESKLSKDTLAPGETATLDLKIKWRSILKAPTQNVLVSLQTSDPIVPRLQLAFLLVPPTAAK